MWDLCEGEWGNHSWVKQCIQHLFLQIFSCTISIKPYFNISSVIWYHKVKQSLREGPVIYALSIFQHFKPANLRALFTAFKHI